MRVNLFELILSMKPAKGEWHREKLYFPDGTPITSDSLKRYKTVICLNDK